MKLLNVKMVMLIGIILTLFSSCKTINHSMKQANTIIELKKSDFSLSEQVSAHARSTTIFGIDFARLFTKKSGTINKSSLDISLASIPVIGISLGNRTSNYALYELMKSNKGYDVVFYPQYEIKITRPILGIGFLLKITNVNVNARLGKLNK